MSEPQKVLGGRACFFRARDGAVSDFIMYI